MDSLKKVLHNASRRSPDFDPATLGDPVALTTAWTPAKSGGTNIGTHRLVEVSPRRMEFRAGGLALAFPALFMVIGAGVMIGMVAAGLSEGDRHFLYMGVPFGTIFFLVGFFILRAWKMPRVFDRRAGLYWRGKEQPFLPNRLDRDTQCRLEEIHALQLLREFCHSGSGSSSSSYFSYELNLVLEDGQRLNVVDHGKLSMLRADASRLAAFLEVPLWDAIDS